MCFCHRRAGLRRRSRRQSVKSSQISWWHTHLVSFILVSLRVSTSAWVCFLIHMVNIMLLISSAGQWRQETFRPQRALPRDVAKHGGVARRSHPAMGRAAIDFVIGFMCLGIPFLFMDRPHSRRADVESGITLSSPAPVLMIGACSCLVVRTFISLLNHCLCKCLGGDHPER